MDTSTTVRQRELEAQGFSPPYALDIAHTESREERARTQKVVVRKRDREPYADRMGAASRFYLDGYYDDTATQDWWVFTLELKGESGSHRHQGGIALFILEGRGATIIEGERYEWKKGDVVLLPIVPGELEHQHIGLTDDACWLGIVHVPTFDAVASQIVQLTDREEWKESAGV